MNLPQKPFERSAFGFSVKVVNHFITSVDTTNNFASGVQGHRGHNGRIIKFSRSCVRTFWFWFNYIQVPCEFLLTC